MGERQRPRIRSGAGQRGGCLCLVFATAVRRGNSAIEYFWKREGMGR